LKCEAEWSGDVPDDSDDEWLEEGEGEETATALEGEQMEVAAEAGKKDQEKADTVERDIRNEYNCNANVKLNSCLCSL